MKNLIRVGTLAVAILSLASCDYQKYNSMKQSDYRRGDFRKDYQAGDAEVYGRGKDSGAVQANYKYAPQPELEQRTQKIREKLFGGGTIGEGA
jgi:hypothetical protein